MSLIDQFEVQFNELSNSEILEGSLDEIQPVELAGVSASGTVGSVGTTKTIGLTGISGAGAVGTVTP